MNTGFKYRLIAFILLTFFSINTVAGFACSLGINLGYNAGHHPRVKSDPVPAPHSLPHQDHQHADKMKDVQHPSPGKPCDPVKDCCSNQVKEFLKLDKKLVHNGLLVKVPVFTITPPALFPVALNEPGTGVNSTFQFVRRSTFLYDIEIFLAKQSLRI